MQFFRQKAVKLAWHSESVYGFLNGAVNLITADFGYWKICRFDLSMELGGGRLSSFCGGVAILMSRKALMERCGSICYLGRLELSEAKM